MALRDGFKSRCSIWLKFLTLCPDKNTNLPITTQTLDDENSMALSLTDIILSTPSILNQSLHQPNRQYQARPGTINREYRLETV